jgi:pilus assembly protein FimV
MADDPLETKLELAQEFREIGDNDGARSLAQEVAAEATGALKARAQRMVADLS